MEKYQWQVTENKTVARAERGAYWILIIALITSCVMLTVDNLKLRDYKKHEHQYNVHKGLENEQ